MRVPAPILPGKELRTQRVLEDQRDLVSPRSSVVRDGRVQRIASQDLVVGDRLACDADLLQGHGLRLDESLLTGESVPVDKLPNRGGDPASARLSAGTLVVQATAWLPWWPPACARRWAASASHWLPCSRARAACRTTWRTWCGSWRCWPCSPA
jgi:magnesium-transporting ATPase (P-type)